MGTVNRPELQSVVMSTLQSIAPEVEAAELAADQPLRNQVDLDSMDWLNFLIGLHQKLKVEIPESDYAKLRTLNDLLEYLGAKMRGTADTDTFLYPFAGSFTCRTLPAWLRPLVPPARDAPPPRNRKTGSGWRTTPHFAARAGGPWW